MYGRREFLRRMIACLPAGVVAAGAFLQSCADSSDDSSSSGDPECSTDGDYNWKISGNHGHTVDLTTAQVNADTPVTLELTLGNGHMHTVDLAATDLAAVGDGDAVSMTSSTDTGHSHTVTFNCVPASSGGGGGYYLNVRMSSHHG